MRKALELTVYERNADGDYIERDRGMSFVHAQELADVYAMSKWLTDAELAAEYHAQHMESVRACDRAYPWGVSEDLDIANERICTLDRFATLPHYDEVA